MAIGKKNAKRAAAATPKPSKPRAPAHRPTVGDDDAAKASGAKPAANNMLVAGFQAISDAHQEALARQRGVFESLLGLGPRDESAAAPPPERESPLAAGALDPFGFRKFEDVFDQRVARALERLESPTGAAFAELRRELDALRARVAALEAAARKR